VQIGGSATRPFATLNVFGNEYCAAHMMSDIDARVRNSAAGSIIANLTCSLAELFFARIVPRDR
jgi:hypothetical protein